MADALLIYGSPELSADLFHAVPAGIIDPFLYVETGDRRAATASVLDADKVRALGVEILDPYSLGRDELLKAGRADHEIDAEVALRACRALGVERAAGAQRNLCLLYTSPSPRDRTRSRMPSSA